MHTYVCNQLSTCRSTYGTFHKKLDDVRRSDRCTYGDRPGYVRCTPVCCTASPAFVRCYVSKNRNKRQRGETSKKAPYAESSSSFSIWLSTNFKSAAVFFPVKPLPGFRPILPSFAYFLKNSTTPDFDTTCPSLAKSSAIFRKLLPSRLKSRIRCFT